MSTDTNTTTPTASVTGLTLEAAIESLTGFDEIAIESHFNGFDVYGDGSTKPMRAMRSIAFVWLRRDGLNDRDAYQAAQNLSFKDLLGYFEEPEDADGDLDDGPSGKA